MGGEREWRHVGDLSLPQHFIGLCPENEIDLFRDHCAGGLYEAVPFIDPRWGLEQIIARLAGFPAADINVL